MKKKNKLGLLVASALFVTGSLLIYENYSVFKGKRENDADKFKLEFEAMNQKDHKRFSLKKGDKLHVSYNISKGRCSLLINLIDKEIFKDKKAVHDDFYLDIEEDGDYEIEIIAKHAKGYISFEVNK